MCIGKLSKKFANAVRCALVIALLFPALAFGAAHDLVIYHTNDVHGYAFEELDGEGKVTKIGYDRLKALIDADPSPRKLLLDAGDVLHGQSFAVAKRGELAAAVLSMTGYDALAVGNHDFDYGQARLKELADKYRLKFISSNIMNEGGYFLPPYTVRSWDGLTVGIFGLSTPMTQTSTNPVNVAGLRFDDPIEVSREMVSRLKQDGADLIIAVAHLGSEAYCTPSSLTLGKEVPGIDIIIDGHSHSTVTTSVRTEAGGGAALVASTGESFQNVGRVTVDRAQDGKFTIAAETLPASSMQEVTPDLAMRAAMNALKAEFEQEMSAVVMKAPFILDGERERIRSGSTNLGRIISAALAEATSADAAIINGGSVRASIPAGDVTKGELLSVLPYGNYVYVIDISGQDLMDAVSFGIANTGSGAFPQFWGMEVAAREKPEKNGFTVEAITIGGKQLDLSGTYTLAINDFLYSGGDGYSMFGKYPYREFATLEETFRNFVTAKDAQALKAISDAEVLKIVPVVSK